MNGSEWMNEWMRMSEWEWMNERLREYERIWERECVWIGERVNECKREWRSECKCRWERKWEESWVSMKMHRQICKCYWMNNQWENYWKIKVSLKDKLERDKTKQNKKFNKSKISIRGIRILASPLWIRWLRPYWWRPASPSVPAQQQHNT